MKGTRILISLCCEWKDRPCGLHRKGKELVTALDFSPQGPSCPTLESQSESPATAPGKEGALDSRPHPPKPAAVPQGCPEQTLFLTRAVHSG